MERSGRCASVRGWTRCRISSSNPPFLLFTLICCWMLAAFYKRNGSRSYISSNVLGVMHNYSASICNLNFDCASCGLHLSFIKWSHQALSSGRPLSPRARLFVLTHPEFQALGYTVHTAGHLNSAVLIPRVLETDSGIGGGCFDRPTS